MAHDGLCGLTPGSPSCTKTQLTATLGQLTLFDGSPVRVGVRACMHIQCVCVRVCVRIPPESLYGRMVYQMAR